MSPAVIAIGITAAVVVLGAMVAVLRAASARSGLRIRTPWIVAAVLSLVVGVVVAPRLLGFTFLFLPLFWSVRLRRPPGPRPSGDTDRDRWWDPSDEDR